MIDFVVDPADTQGNTIILSIGVKATHHVRVLAHDGFIKNENTYDEENKRFFPTHLRKWGTTITVFEDEFVKQLKKQGVPEEDALEHRYPSDDILHIQPGAPVHVFHYNEKVNRVIAKECFVKHQGPIEVYDEDSPDDHMTRKEQYYYVTGFELPVHPVFVRRRTIKNVVREDIKGYGLLDSMKSFGRLAPITLNDLERRKDDYYFWIRGQNLDEYTKKPIDHRKGMSIVTKLQPEFGKDWSMKATDPLTNEVHDIPMFDMLVRANNFISVPMMFDLANRADAVVHNLISPEFSPYTVFISRYVKAEIPDMFNVFKSVLYGRTTVEYDDAFVKDVVDTIQNPTVFCFGIVMTPPNFKGWPYFRFPSAHSAANFVTHAHKGIVSERSE